VLIVVTETLGLRM